MTPTVQLQELVKPNRPVTYGIVKPGPDTPGGVPYVRVVDIQDGRILSDRLRRTTEKLAASYKRSSLQSGDLLISIRGHVGRMAFVPPELEGANITQDTARLSLGKRCIPNFVRWYIASPGAQRWIAERIRGVAVTGINLGDLRELPIPLPPLPEQNRIAAILDKADAVRRKRQEAIRLTEELLRAAFLEMFGDPVVNPKGWEEQPFGELVVDTHLGLVRASADQGPDRQYEYIRMDSIRRDGLLQLAGLARVDATNREATACSLARGDLLFNTRNTKELVGKTAVYRGDGSHLFNNNIMRVRFRKGISADYINQYLLSQRGQHELNMRKSGTTTVFAIYYKQLATLPVPSPPAALQARYARVVDAVVDARRAERNHDDHVAQFASSLTQRAFSGRL